MSEVNIEQASLQDLDLLMHWRMIVLKEVFSLDAHEDLTELHLQNKQYYEKTLSDNTHIACFAKKEGKIVGCGGICLYSEMPSPDNLNGLCGYLMNIYVCPDMRRQKIGEAIVHFLIEQARLREVKKITLESSERGRKLYQTIGFIEEQDMMILKDSQ